MSYSVFFFFSSWDPKTNACVSNFTKRKISVCWNNIQRASLFSHITELNLAERTLLDCLYSAVHELLKDKDVFSNQIKSHHTYMQMILCGSYKILVAIIVCSTELMSPAILLLATRGVRCFVFQVDVIQWGCNRGCCSRLWLGISVALQNGTKSSLCSSVCLVFHKFFQVAWWKALKMSLDY